MQSFFVAWLAVLASGAAAADVPSRMVNRVKQTTVLVKASTIRGDQRGCGFLLFSKSGVGYVATNTHIIQQADQPSRRVECVFHVMEKNEFTLPASVAAVDVERDLAILEVKSANLPPPLSLADEPAPRDSLPVWIIGCPPRDAPAANAGAPTALASGRVSGVQRDQFGNVMKISIAGDVSPTQSGGPIVDEDARLIGIAVAPEGQERDVHGLPSALISDMLWGHVDSVKVIQTSESRARVGYDFDVTFIDPMRKMRMAFVHVIPQERVKGNPPRNRDGTFGLAAQGMRAYKLTVDNGRARGTVFVEADDGQVPPHLYQVRYLRGDGSTHFTAPTVLRAERAEASSSLADDGPTNAEPNARLAPPAQWPKPSVKLASAGLELIQLGAPKIEKRLAGKIKSLVVGGAGRYFILQFEQTGELAVFDVNQGDVVKQIPAPADARFAACVDKLVIISPADGVIDRWSLTRMRKEKSNSVRIKGEIVGMAMGSAAHGPVLLEYRSSAQRGLMLGLLDASALIPIPIENARIADRRTGFRPVKVGEYGEVTFPAAAYGDRSAVRAAAAGHVFGIWSPPLARGGMVLLVADGMATALFHDAAVGHLCPTADGSAVCTARGYFTADLSAAGPQHYFLPSSHPRYGIAIPLAGDRPTDGKIYELEQARVVGKLPSLEHMTALSQQRTDARSELLLDQRYHYLPQARILITIPAGEDQLVFQQVDFTPAPLANDLVEAATDARKVTAEPPAGGLRPRTWKDKSGRFEIVATFVSQNRAGILLKRDNGRSIRVPLDKLSDEDIQYVKEITATDKGARDR